LGEGKRLQDEKQFRALTSLLLKKGLGGGGGGGGVGVCGVGGGWGGGFGLLFWGGGWGVLGGWGGGGESDIEWEEVSNIYEKILINSNET